MPAAKTAALHTRTHAIVGTDEGKVKEVALRLLQQHTDPAGGDFSNEIIDGNAENAEAAARICRDVCLALQTLPFFGNKVVWLKMANFLGDSVTGRAEAAVTGFESILDVLEAGLPEQVTFILSATALDKRRTSYKRLGKLTSIEQHDRPDVSKAGWQGPVLATARAKAQELGITFESGALELLVELAGDDTRQMENELIKIDLYLGERRRAGVQSVRQLVSMTRGAVIWDLGNAIGARDLPRSLAQLDVLLGKKENPVGLLLAAIIPRVRNMLIVKDLITKHRIQTANYNSFGVSLEALPVSATGHLPRKKDGTGLNVYPLFLALSDAANFTIEELRASHRACLEANLKLVTTQLDERLVLERLLISILSGRNSRRR